MNIIHEFINPEDIDVSKLDPNEQYDTEVVDTFWRDGNLVIKLKFIGTIYDRNNPQCLLPLKVEVATVAEYDNIDHVFTD